MPLTITLTEIPDVMIIQPKVFGDDRGFFFESFNEREFAEATGIKTNFVQDNHSMSKRGVLRGLHYQTDYTQGKLVRVARGSVFDVAVDLRESSKTFKKWIGVELSADNHKQLWVPPGFAHGFLVLSDEAEFLYKTTNYWHAASEQSLLWNDPTLGIQWPELGMSPSLAAKDAVGMTWDMAPKFA
jgi:dTDP-4-dehydrorhamnose 3,5-epimerase